MTDIKIGTIVSPQYIATIPELIAHGFETFAISFWETAEGYDLSEMAKQVKELLGDSGCTISCIGVYGNAQDYDGRAESARNSWNALIDTAQLFGTDLVTGFTGRVVDVPIDESIPRFVEVYKPLVEKARDKGIRIAFENCDMGGDWRRGYWNMAFTPRAWELMFNALPYDNIGLQWEPCHQMVQLVDPIPQLRKWVGKMFNIHGKDATVAWDVIRECGTHSGVPYCWHRTPGFGDSNWTDIISILRMNGYSGSVDIEGFHDPVYNGELEYTGQVHALNYLKQCRGGAFIPNPKP